MRVKEFLELRGCGQRDPENYADDWSHDDVYCLVKLAEQLEYEARRATPTPPQTAGELPERPPVFMATSLGTGPVVPLQYYDKLHSIATRLMGERDAAIEQLKLSTPLLPEWPKKLIENNWRIINTLSERGEK